MQNFGKIKNTFYNILIEAIVNKDKEKKAIFSQYINAIKSSKILTTEFLIYTNLEGKSEVNEMKALEFVKLNHECLNGFNRNDILAENEKLVKLLGKYQKRLDRPYEKQSLHETISDLIFTRKCAAKVNKITESINKIVDYIKENKPKEPIKENLIPTSAIATVAINKFNEKYAELTEDEKFMFKTLIEIDETVKEDNQKLIINECITLIDEKINETSVDIQDKLLKAKHKLLTITYDSDGYTENMNKLLCLKMDLNSN